jgi:hypothetical protein
MVRAGVCAGVCACARARVCVCVRVRGRVNQAAVFDAARYRAVATDALWDYVSGGMPCRERLSACTFHWDTVPRGIRAVPCAARAGNTAAACSRLQEEPRTEASRWIRLSLWNGTRRWRPAAEAPILCTNPLTWLPSSDCTKADGTGKRPPIPYPPLPSFGTVLCACMRVRVSVRLSVCLCVSECLCVVGCVCGRGCVCISGYGAGLWRGMCVERTAPAAPPSAREFLGPTLVHTVRRIERY